MNRQRVPVLAVAACLLLVVTLGVVVTGLISELKGITDVTEAAFGALGVTWLVGQWVLAGLISTWRRKAVAALQVPTYPNGR